MKTATLINLYNLASQSKNKMIKITDVNLIAELKNAKSKEIKKYFNNRKNGTPSVFYSGDKFLRFDCNCFGEYYIGVGEVVKSDWNKAYGVHSPNGFVCTKLQHGNGNKNEFVIGFMQAFDFFLLSDVN